VKASSDYQEVLRLTDLIAAVQKDMLQYPSYAKASYVQKLQRYRKKLQANLKPTLVTGKLNEDP
jgi:hypothetical protein